VSRPADSFKEENDPLSEDYQAEMPAPEPEPEPEAPTAEETSAPEAQSPLPEPDAPEQPALAEGEEPASGEAPSPPEAETEPEPEEDWKRRHDILRDTQRRTAEDRNELQRQRDEAMRAVAEARQAMVDLQAKVAGDPEMDQLRAKATELGLEPEQLDITAQMAQRIADEKISKLQSQFEQERERTANERIRSERMRVIDDWKRSHEDWSDAEPEMMAVLREVGAIDQNGVFADDELRTDHLEIAYEASKDPSLRAILAAMPILYESDEGLMFARKQASLEKLIQQLPGTSTPKSETQPAQTQATEAALKEAETLPASSGPSVTSTEPPQDEFDEVLALDGNKPRSVFTR
jgi:hypothetical protein